MNPWDGLSWGDIDWDILKKGMLITPNDAFSFSKYLNVFLWAGQEKYKMITGELADYVVDEFKPTDIILPRLGRYRENDNKHFAGQIRNLIFLYRHLLGSVPWCREDAMNISEGDWKLANVEDYELYRTEQDIIDVMGEEAYEIFTDAGGLPLYKILKASLFKGLYELYKTLNYYYFSSFQYSSTIPTEPEGPRPTVILSNTTYVNEYRAPDDTTYETAYASFRSSITGPISENTVTSYPSGRSYKGGSLSFMSYRADKIWLRRTWYFRLISTRELKIGLNQQDLNDNSLDIDVSNIIVSTQRNYVYWDPNTARGRYVDEYTDIIDRQEGTRTKIQVLAPQKSDNNSVSISLGDLFF